MEFYRICSVDWTGKVFKLSLGFKTYSDAVFFMKLYRATGATGFIFTKDRSPKRRIDKYCCNSEKFIKQLHRRYNSKVLDNLMRRVK